MDDPTVEFRFIPFVDVRDAAFSSDRIPRADLQDRILFARTSLGNYAKFRVQGGRNLLIRTLVVYDPAGCILRTAHNVSIRSSYFCDLDNAAESATDADFWWEGVTPTAAFLVPRGAATLHRHRGFDEVTFDELRAAPYRRDPIPGAFLIGQVLYCRTTLGRFAKLRVEAASSLQVKRLVVYDSSGGIYLDRSDIEVPAAHSLDVDAGAVTTGGAELRWDAGFLTPTAGAVSYESWHRFRKYKDLLDDPGINAAMLVGDRLPYRDHALWTDAERWQLWEFIQLREMGRALPIAGPPALLRRDAPYISRCDAWKIYLAHVAHSLWVDVNARVPWRIAGAGAAQLEALFRMDTVFSGAPDRFHLGSTTQWNPEGSYRFLSGAAMVGPDHGATIRNLVEWCRMHLWHGGFWFGTTEQDFLEALYGYRGPALVDRMIDPLPGTHNTTLGCGYTDSFLRSLLRTVNLPMRQGTTVFDGFPHSRAEFFTVGFNLAHGDDPYDGWTYRGHNIVPIERIFYNDAELFALIDHPPVRPGMTLSQQTSFNHQGRLMALAVEYTTEYLLHHRCEDRRRGLTGHASALWVMLHEHYSDARIDAIAAQCDRELDAIGGCGAVLWP